MSEYIYNLVGGNHLYQYFILFFIFISQINNAFNILMPIFINHYQDFLCITPRNETYQIWSHNGNQFKGVDNMTGFLVIDTRKCNYENVTKICSQINLVPDPMESTIRSQFNLYCEYSGLSSVAVLCFMVGICLGSLFGGIFVDNYGRIIGCILSYSMLSLFSTVATLSPWFVLHAVARLLAGFAVSLSFVSNSGMILEVVEMNQRTNFGFLWSLGYDFGFCILVVLAYFIKNHFYLQMSFCCVSYVSLVFPYFYKESFRWLLVKKKYKEAKTVLQHIAKFNRRFPTENEVDNVIEIFEEERLKCSVGIVSLKEVFKFKLVLVNLLILWFLYFSSSFSYYTFVLGSSKISEKLFVATTISATMSMLCRITYMFLCRRFGRITILLSLQIGLVFLFMTSMILKYVLGAKNIITGILLMFAIAMSGTNFGFMWVYGGEAFPTVIRATSVSIGSACARVSGMIATQMEWVFDVSPNTLPIVGAIMAIVGSLCTFFVLPETFKRPSLDFLSQAQILFAEWRQPWRKRSSKISEIEIKENKL